MWKRLSKNILPTAGLLAGLLAALSLAGCASYVTSNVTAFTAWGDPRGDKPYAFEHVPDQRNSIEQQTYEHLVESELAPYGFTLVAPDQARYLVSLAYSVQNRTVIVPEPVFYQPWPGPWRGPFGPGWYPLGPAGYVEQAYPLFVHRLTLRIVERASGQERYKVTATNTGASGSLVQAMPYLVRSALADFPLQNGTVRRVRLPFDPSGGASPSNERAVVPAPAAPAAAPRASAAPATATPATTAQ